MKKLIALLLTMAMTFGLLAGCKKKAEEPSASSGTPTTGAPGNPSTPSADSQPGNQEDNRPYADPITIAGEIREYRNGELLIRTGESYDPATRILTKYSSYGAKSFEQEYDQKGYLIRSTDLRSGDATKYEYNAAGNVTRRTGYYSNGQLRSDAKYEYDADGNLICIATYDAEGKLTGKSKHEYDADGRMIRDAACYPDGKLESETKYEYDADGNTTETSYDGNGNITNKEKYKYNEDNQCLYSADYDDTGKLTNETEYNADGEPIRRVSYQEGKMVSEEKYEYDATGRLIRIANYDAEGKLTYEMKREFDAVGELTYEAIYKDGVLEKETKREGEYEYDDAGNITRARYTYPNANNAPVSVYKYEYDADGNMICETKYKEIKKTGTKESEEILNAKTEYDAAGRKTKETYYTKEGQEIDRFEYDAPQTITFGPTA